MESVELISHGLTDLNPSVILILKIYIVVHHKIGVEILKNTATAMDVSIIKICIKIQVHLSHIHLLHYE